MTYRLFTNQHKTQKPNTTYQMPQMWIIRCLPKASMKYSISEIQGFEPQILEYNVEQHQS